MRSDKQQAIKLRLQGKSYLEINRILGVPKSTLSGWLDNVILSENARKQIQLRTREASLAGLLKRNKKQTADAIKRAALIRLNAAKEIQTISKKDLLILGASLYWAEGYKRPMIRKGKEVTYHKVSLTNSDPVLAKAFIRFLREYCGIPLNKIKIGLRIFPHLNEMNTKVFWSKQTGIPLTNFQKTYSVISKSSLGKRPFNRLPYGVIQIIVSETRLFHRVMGHVEGIKSLV